MLTNNEVVSNNSAQTMSNQTQSNINSNTQVAINNQNVQSNSNNNSSIQNISNNTSTLSLMSSTTSSSNVVFSGYLMKWTNYIKGYQKRWFVLNNGLLSYFRLVINVFKIIKI
jgi:hypothetical protein